MKTSEQQYGSVGGGQIRPMRVTRTIKGEQLRQRRIAIIAAMCALVGLLVLLVTKVNPESEEQRERTLGHLSILKLTWDALAAAWAKDHAGKKAAYSVPTDVNVMFGVDCCDPDMCSKYALERCKSNRQSQRNQDDDKEDEEIQQYLSSTSSPSSSSSSSSSISSSLHSGAARAAAALGLNLVARTSSPLRSYYAQKREAAEREATEEEDSDAPAPTVGLIHRERRRHVGALQAAEAFGLHLANVPQGSVQPPANPATGEVHLDSTGGRVQSLLQVEAEEGEDGEEGEEEEDGEAPGREEELVNIFDAPMRMAEGAVDQGLRAAGGYIARDARHVSDEHAVTTVGGCGRAGGAATSVEGCGQERSGFVSSVEGRATQNDAAVTSIDGRARQRSDYVTTVGGYGARRDDFPTKVEGQGQGRSDYVTEVHTHLQPTDGMVTTVDGHVAEKGNAGVVTQVDGFVRPSTGMVTGINARGVANSDGSISYSSHLDASGQPSCNGQPCPIQAGPLFKTAGTKGGLQTPGFADAAAHSGIGGGPFGQWQAPEGWEDGRADDKFSITVQPKCGVTPGFPCPHAEAHLKVEVYCPPYTAPAHGAVWYRGRKYRGSTSKGASRDRKTVNLFGEPVAIAEDGDIPEGELVKVECDAHYRLSEEGCATPRCLPSGEFERGKVCEPIMCAAYQAPPHGMVIPAAPVMAGEAVTILCDEGYDAYYGEEETAAEAPRPSTLRAVKPDPWTDFSSWFAGPNQGRSGNLISMDATEGTAKATVAALGGSRARGAAARELVRRRLERVGKQLEKVKAEQRGEQGKVGMGDAILHMSEGQLDRMVRQYVTAGAAPGGDGGGEKGGQRGRGGRRRLLGAEGGEEGAGGRGGWGGGEELVARVKSGLRRKQEQQRRKATPVCLDSARFERGILCRKKPLPPGPPPPAGAPVVPRGMYIVPLVCPSYIAPDHGSVWYGGREFRIATASGIKATEIVRVTCHRHFRPSEIGSATPRCRRDGQWEVGKTCEPVYCADYGSVQNGFVSTHDYVRAGTRIQLTCHEWYQPVGMEEGGRADPMCLDSGSFEKGIQCVPKPCPKTEVGSEPCPLRQREAMSRGIEPKVSKEKIKDWEDELRRPLVGDYNPNVFDHEPRPYSLDISTSDDDFNPLPWPPNRHFNPSYDGPTRLDRHPTHKF